MSKLSFALLAVASIAAACYQNETSAGSPLAAGTQVLLTDAPFPFDAVQSVQVYIVSIALSRLIHSGSHVSSSSQRPLSSTFFT